MFRIDSHKLNEHCCIAASEMRFLVCRLQTFDYVVVETRPGPKSRHIRK